MVECSAISVSTELNPGVLLHNGLSPESLKGPRHVRSPVWTHIVRAGGKKQAKIEEWCALL